MPAAAISSRISITCSMTSGAEPERRLVGDQHPRRLGQQRCERQHLLLTARQHAGRKLATLPQGGEALVDRFALLASSTRRRFSSTVSPAKMPRDSGASTRPSRERLYGGRRLDAPATVEHDACPRRPGRGR